MKYLATSLLLLAALSSAAQSNSYYNPDAEPDGQIGSSDLLEFLPLFGNSFTPDTCLCGCPAGSELDSLLVGDTLDTFSFAALVFQQNADSIELTIHLDSYGVGSYPFLGDTLIEYPCHSYTATIEQRCYDFDDGIINYVDYPAPSYQDYCSYSDNYFGLRGDDSGNNLILTKPNITENNAYDGLWVMPDYCQYVQLSADTWAMIPDNFSDEQPAPTDCFNYLGGDSWDVCFRLTAFEVRFID